MSDVKARLKAVNDKIAAAAKAAGRAVDDIYLIAVSKTFDGAAIRPALAAGQRLFGENRVQEAQGKWPALKADYPDARVHLIGPLQSNKTKDAVALFDAIHTIDRPKIARAVAKEMAAQGRKLQLFVQVNTGEEPQKAGILPGEAAAFVALCRGEIGLEVAGLMAIPPLAEMAEPHFAFLAKLARDLSLPGQPPLALSMGMSADFETAISLGASHVRVGSAIFGAR